MKSGSAGEIANAVLAAVLPEHRRMVLGEVAEVPIRFHGDADQVHRGLIEAGALELRRAIRRLAAAAPSTGLSAPMPAGNAPAVPEDYPFVQIGRQAAEQCQAKFSCPSCRCILDAGHPGRCDEHCGQPAVPEDTPGGFHEPDEPTDHIAAAFDAGTHGRTAPPRGQTRRLDVAALTYGEMEAERDRLARELYEAQVKIADYDNRITWDTTCGSCATVLDASIRETERAEKAGADRRLRGRGLVPLNTAGATKTAERDVIEAAKAWYATCDPHAITAPDVRAAGIQLGAAVDALPDAGTQPCQTPSDAKSGAVPLADVLDALRDDDAYSLWALAQTHVDRCQPTELGASRREILARYLAERFAPTALEGADERNDHHG